MVETAAELPLVERAGAPRQSDPRLADFLDLKQSGSRGLRRIPSGAMVLRDGVDEARLSRSGIREASETQ